ncbi:D-ribose ABC transporter substrate-binding protein [Microbacterium sp. SORGH_AS_0888]|uniref:D-ribose ABC transporter substrate-binding protein n=1 Tax=Microbacterium sp. SORGH_AS_0888 TaxID=3041791 RepID=UPI002788532D|nr:D-ribose ABC transporter substrate-binding protein [Microbacterium sp. SORGH_AS_0888]MDQ1130050.1 erythritol transport system substrate-binding protein [Microbacterium sp. SORGH_AS_0888]
MVRRKALVALAAAGALVMGLSGCAGGTTGGATNSGGAAGGLITIIVNDPANPYWKTEGDIAAAEAKQLGYQATVGAHKGDTNTENTLIDTAIANKSVAIILDPANADGSIAAVKKADAAGIPVFLVNAEINQSGIAKAQLVSNNAQGAALGAQQWESQMGGKGTYVELLGAPSDNNAQTRSNGYATVLSQYPDLVKVGQEVADWDRTKGHDKMQSLLQANPSLNGVISGNDEMALGAIAALKEAGKLNGVVVGGFDGAPDAIDAISSGELAYTVLQPVAEFSKKAVELADEYIRTGKAPDTEKQAFDCILITKDNVGKMTGPFTYSG